MTPRGWLAVVDLGNGAEALHPFRLGGEGEGGAGDLAPTLGRGLSGRKAPGNEPDDAGVSGRRQADSERDVIQSAEAAEHLAALGASLQRETRCYRVGYRSVYSSLVITCGASYSPGRRHALLAASSVSSRRPAPPVAPRGQLMSNTPIECEAGSVLVSK